MSDDNKLTIDDLALQMKQGFDNVDKKFDDFDQKMKQGFDNVDKKFDDVNQKIQEQSDEIGIMVKQGFDEVSGQFKVVNARLDSIEDDIAAIKQRLDVIEEMLDKIDRLTLVDYRRRIEYLEGEVRQLKKVVLLRQAV